jgi:hypothetical protein
MQIGYNLPRGHPMGTDDFKADISAAIKKFTQRNRSGVPHALKITAEDAMVWHSAVGTRESTHDFLENRVRPYLATVPCNGQRLSDCLIEILADESGEQSRFE